MRIQHNISALNAHRQLGTNNEQVSKNLEKLSSGYRINRAGDDAAGLAISEKMRGQIRGLDQAKANAQDGISLIQTAEGGLNETHSILQRMRELSVQSANGTYQDKVDRENLNKEMEALKGEIDRIASSTHFNKINLLNGELAGTTTPAGKPAVDGTAIKTTNSAGSAAIKASIDITLDGTTAATGLAITGGTTKVSDIAAMMLGGKKVSDLFNIEIDGTAKDWTTHAADLTSSGGKVKLIAKTPGELTTGVMTALNAVKAKSTNVTAGAAAGAGTPATKAEYTLKFDFKNLKDGDTFQIGAKTFEMSTDGVVNTTGNELIDLSNLDLTVLGKTGEGQFGAAEKIVTAVNSAFGTEFADVKAIDAAQIKSDSYTMTLTGGTAGDVAANQGAVRETSTGISATYTVGKAAGKADPAKFATVSYGIDLTKLALGDKLSIGGVDITIAEGSDVDPAAGKISLADAQNATKLSETFESLGFQNGKISFSSNKITITSKDIAETADQLLADAGKMTFTPKIAPAAGVTTGGINFQIGANGSADQQVNLKIDNMNATGIGVGSTNILTQVAANDAITSIDDAINKVSGTRADLGALQNRLEHTVANLGTTSENLTAAESRIRDVDMAKEMMEMTKNNILTQAAQSMLAQANTQPQGVLQLLR